MGLYHYIDIGCADFDNSFYEVKDDQRAILVDPRIDMLANIPNKPNVIKAPFAIGAVTEVRKLYYISDENIRKYRLYYWMRGCSCLDKIHPTLIEYKVPETLIEIQPVLMLSWFDFMRIYSISRITTLKIDTEGSDFWIMKCIMKYPVPIETIIFEMNRLSDKSEFIEVHGMYKKAGYQFEQIEGDNYKFYKG